MMDTRFTPPTRGNAHDGQPLRRHGSSSPLPEKAAEGHATPRAIYPSSELDKRKAAKTRLAFTCKRQAGSCLARKNGKTAKANISQTLATCTACGRKRLIL